MHPDTMRLIDRWAGIPLCFVTGLWSWIKIKRKAELEAFSKYGLTNITDKYLPQKLEIAKSL